MRKFKTAILLLVLLTFTGEWLSIPVNAKPSPMKELQVGHLFNDVQGTIVMKNLKTNQVLAYNLERSRERFTPESTFKIPNALIGIHEQVVEDEYDVKRWDGVEREFAVWNRDHTLASAMRHSAIWYYQELARDIGPWRMQRNLNRIQYGNQDISGGIDTFWLDSSLTISAQEQVSFVEQLVNEKLPYDKQTMKTIKRMMIDNEQDDYTIHGKSGTRLSDFGLGWYVGYVETNKNIWVFATNIEGSGTAAKNITLDCLKYLNIINDTRVGYAVPMDRRYESTGEAA